MPRKNDAPQPKRVEIDADTSMPVLLGIVKQYAGQEIVLVVPDDAPVLLTVSEFRALKDTADRANIRLVLDGGAGLRGQLASMIGIRSAAAPQQQDSGWRPPNTLLGNARAFDTWGANEDEENVAPRRKRRRDQQQDRPRRPETRETETASLDYIKSDEPSEIGATAKRIGQIVAVILVASLIATIAGWYALPNVKIVAQMKTTTVSSEVNYAVAEDGASLPSDIAFTAPATAAEADVPYSISVPTTGVDRTPQETARGQVLLRNPTANAINVPQGTALTIHGGASYTTQSDVEVPPAANNIAGEATVEVVASEAGSAGNAEPGMLTGVVPELGVHYSNRDGALEGGTDIEVAIVTDADIQALEDKLLNEHSRAAAAGWNSQLPEGQTVVVPSVKTDLPTDRTSAQPGDQAEEISVSGTIHATGLIYDRATTVEQANVFFRESLQQQVPAGYRIDPDSITLSDPIALASAPNNVQFRVTGSATAYAVIDDALLADIRKRIAGADWDKAHAILDGVEQFERYELSISPGWWFKRMPQDSGRVDIQVADPLRNNPESTPAATVPS